MWLFISIDTDTDSLNLIFSKWTQREFFNKLRAICRRKLLTSSWAGEKKQKQMWLGITLSGKIELFLAEVVLNLKPHANFRSSQVLQQLAPILYFLRPLTALSNMLNRLNDTFYKTSWTYQKLCSNNKYPVLMFVPEIYPKCILSWDLKKTK